MNKRLLLKLSIDFFMFAIFLWLMAYPITTHHIHEILGVIFIVLLVTHNVLNGHWYKSLRKGKYNLIRLLHTTVNLLLVLLILVNIISALGISLWLFVFLPFDWGITGREFHILSAYWGMIILAIHIGFHWDMLMGIARKNLHISLPNAQRTKMLRVFTLIIAIYGLYAASKLEIVLRLIAYYSYFFFDQSQSYFLLIIDYLAFLGLCIAITHYGLKLLRYIRMNIGVASQLP